MILLFVLYLFWVGIESTVNNFVVEISYFVHELARFMFLCFDSFI